MNDAAYERWLQQFKIIGDQAYSPEELPYQMRQMDKQRRRRAAAKLDKVAKD